MVLGAAPFRFLRPRINMHMLEEEGDWNWFEAGLAGIALTLGLINILEWELNVRRLRPNVRLGPNVHLRVCP